MARKTVRAVALFLAAILISQVFPLAALADEPEEIFESYRDTAVYYGLKPESDPTELKKELTYQDFYEIMSRFASLKNGMTIEEFANAKDISVALNGSNVPRDLAIYLGVRSYISMPPEGKMLQDELAEMLSEYLTKVVAPLPAMTYYADSQYRRYNFVDDAPLASSRQFVQEALLESVALSKGDSAESGTFSSGSTITREQFICAMYIIACSSL
ncbi:MAG: hypothetical protein LBC41_12445, partial [Clostridiales bacterium]|nr:hypothetical protein [Clostridiales bacterium]